MKINFKNPVIFRLHKSCAYYCWQGRECLKTNAPNQRYESWRMPKAHSSLGIRHDSYPPNAIRAFGVDLDRCLSGICSVNFLIRAFGVDLDMTL